MFRLSLFFLYSVGLSWPLCAQDYPANRIAAQVQLDSVVVVAQKAGFDVQDFIRLVQEDTSFLTAFQNLRKLSWLAENHLQFYTRKGIQAAAYWSKTKQLTQGNCRSMRVLDERISGNFFTKRNTYRYTTATLYDRVFFTHGTVCQNTTKSDSPPAKERGLDKYYQELKKFIFETGKQVDVPFIGNRTAIFDPKLLPLYDLFIRADTSSTGKPCYVFQIQVKPAYADKRENRTMIKSMETFFERGTLQVLERSYTLHYDGVAFSFDVDMFVRLKQSGVLYYPAEVRYRGDWDIPLHPAEKSQFQARFYPVEPE